MKSERRPRREAGWLLRGLSLVAVAMLAATGPAVAAHAEARDGDHAEARDGDHAGREAIRQRAHDGLQLELNTMTITGDDAWAGAAIDPENPDGSAVLRVKGANGLARARQDDDVARLVAAGQVRLVQVRWSTEDLTTAMGQLSFELRSTLGITDPLATAPFELYLNTEANRLTLTIDPAFVDATTIQTVLARYPGSMVTLRRASLGEVKLATCAPTGCYAPEAFRGGLALNTVSSGNCSSGFTVVNTGAPWVRYTTTAGHCPAGVTYYHGIQPLGSMALRVFVPAASVDAALVPLGPRTGSNLIWRSNDPAADVTAKISDPSAALVGNTLCKTGQASGTTCGTLRAVYGTGYGTGVNWGLMDVKVCEGDSGGPVVNQSSNRAYGLVSFTRATYQDAAGRWCGNTSSGFTWVPRYEYAFASAGYPFKTLLAP